MGVAGGHDEFGRRPGAGVAGDAILIDGSSQRPLSVVDVGPWLRQPILIGGFVITFELALNDIILLKAV